MIVVEILVALIIVTVILVGISKLGAPMVETFATKLRLKYEDMGPETERQLRARMTAMEQEVRELKQQVADLQATADFNSKVQTESKIKIVPEKEQA
jgi:hypothetical protein